MLNSMSKFPENLERFLWNALEIVIKVLCHLTDLGIRLFIQWISLHIYNGIDNMPGNIYISLPTHAYLRSHQPQATQT